VTSSTSLEDVAGLVLDALDDFRATLPEGELPADMTADTVLFGEDGALDSLGIVNVVVLTERRIEDAYGVTVSLADEDALAGEENPFHTIGTYTTFVRALVEKSLANERAPGSAR
jgi:acyl carrier protein